MRPGGSRRALTLLALALALSACGSTVQVRSERLASSSGDGLGAVGQELASGPEQTAQDGALDPAAPAASQDGASGPGPAPGGTAAGDDDIDGSGSGSGIGSGTRPTGDRSTAPAAQTSGARPSGQAPAGAQASGPSRGRGFTATTASIGLEYVEGGDEFTQSAGFGSITVGDTRAVIDTILKDVNAKGGVLGRQIKAVYHATGAAEGTSNPQVTAQSVCSDFTDDNPVIAAVPASPAEVCLAKRQVTTVGLGSRVLDDRELAIAAPWYRLPSALSFDRLGPVLIDRLVAQGYLTKSSKIGLLHPDSLVGTRIAATLKKQLAARGFPVTSSFGFDSSSPLAEPSSVPNAVLPFRSAGVDRVISLNAAVAYFMINAEQQGYRPRYALNSYLNLASVMQSVPPRAQLTGAVGVGWVGPNDVDLARLDTKPPSFDTCRDYIRKSGQNLSGSALFIQTSYCEGVRLILYAAQAGGGFDSASIQRGLALKGASYPSALVLDSALSQRRMDGASAVRDVRYDTACRCFLYGSRTRCRA